jgi:hypothetical protein
VYQEQLQERLLEEVQNVLELLEDRVSLELVLVAARRKKRRGRLR